MKVMQIMPLHLIFWLFVMTVDSARETRTLAIRTTVMPITPLAYRHDRHADKRRYRHYREIDIQMLKMFRNGYILS